MSSTLTNGREQDQTHPSQQRQITCGQQESKALLIKLCLSPRRLSFPVLFTMQAATGPLRMRNAQLNPQEH